MRDGKPIMLFECKHAGADLKQTHASQLYRYFSVVEARIGVLTNGVQYRFFSDMEAPNKMDERPFLEFDMMDPRETLLPELKKLSKSTFNIDELLSAAHELKYTNAIKEYLAVQWNSPTEDLVRLLTKQVYDGLFTQSVREQFTGIVRRALHQFVNERIQGRLTAALREEDTGTSVLVNGEPSDAEPVEIDDGIETTEEEMEGFYIIRAILREVIDVSRIAHRDVKSYFGILLDDNNRKPLCRLHFNTSQKYIGIFGADKQEERIPINSLDDIYQYAERIKATVGLYESSDV